MNRRASIGMIALGAVLTLACTEPSEPGDVTGALEVHLTVDGLLTDSTTHAVVVSAAGLGELPPHSIAYAGGSVLISDLPAGTHSVRLESPAATCWVTNLNPRGFTVTGGQTSRVDFTASCFGAPDIVLDRTTPSSGSTSERYVLEPGGTFRLQFESAGWGFAEIAGRYTSDGLEYRFTFDGTGQQQATGTQVGQCLDIVYNDYMVLSDFESGQFCVGGVPAVLAGTYQRMSPSSSSSISRLVFDETGRYSLQSQWPDYGFFEHLGSYAIRLDGIDLTFDSLTSGDGWLAAVTRSGDSLIVNHVNAPAYPPIEDGVYVRSQDTPLLREAGGRIAFSRRDSDEAAWIHVANPDGSGLTRLAEGIEPAWSGDGHQIAFVRFSTDGSPPAIHVMNDDGSQQLRLREGRTPSWSPDGRQIVFSLDTAILVMDADGANPRELAGLTSPGIPDGSAQLVRPTWSPDGQRIAFDTRGASPTVVTQVNKVQLMAPDGSELRLLAPEAWSEFSAAWSPDGARIAAQTYDEVYDSFATGYDMVLAVFDAPTGVRQVLYHTHMGWLVDGPVWSPDGRYLAFGQQTFGVPERSNLVLDVKTGVVYPLLPGVTGIRDLAWSRN
jgi:WD40 repeat protein